MPFKCAKIKDSAIVETLLKLAASAILIAENERRFSITDRVFPLFHPASARIFFMQLRFNRSKSSLALAVLGVFCTAHFAGATPNSLGGPEANLSDGEVNSKTSAQAPAKAPSKTPKTAPDYKANAQRVPTSNVPPPGVPFVVGVDNSSATDTGGTLAQPPAALGPAPFDLGKIKRMQIGNYSIREQPLRVGNLDVLAPLVEELPMVGATVTSADPRNVPANKKIGGAQYFQINLPRGAPIVLAANSSTAYVDGNEITLRAAPLVIDRQIWLPVFSIAPLMGAATRLSPQGTLYLSPTIQSVELFPVKDTIAVTIKASMPVSGNSYKITKITGANPKTLIEFDGFSMGFDAGNSTMERLVAPGRANVKGVRAAQGDFFPDKTRVVIDYKSVMDATIQKVSDPTIFALVLTPPSQPPIVLPEDVIDPPSPLDPPESPTERASDVTPIAKPLQGMTIIVDAGHGGHDTGAPGRKSKEKEYTLDIARRLQRYLTERGANALLTRSNDTYITLQGRVDFAQSRNADLFISIHMNSSDSADSNGTETFYYTPQSLFLAREIHKEFVSATGRKSRGVSRARFYVIRKTTMPSVLLECAFVSNPTEENIALTTDWRERVARGIMRGVVNYREKYGSDSRG